MRKEDREDPASAEEFYEYGFYDGDLCQVLRIQGEPKGMGPSYRRRRLRVIGKWEEIPR